MRTAALIAALLVLSFAKPAMAETGVGRFTPHGSGALEPNAPSLSNFGDDVIRVRAYPAHTGTWMVELHARPDGSAEGEAVFFDHFRRTTASRPRIGSVRLTVWPEDWAKLVTQVDSLFAEGQAPPLPEKPRADGLGEVCVTADGTAYEIERRRNRRDAWMTSMDGNGYCGGRDPSEAIAQLVFTAAALHLCKAMQGSVPCERGRSPEPDALAEYREHQKP